MPKEDERRKPASPPKEGDKADAERPALPPEQRRLRGYDRLEEVARLVISPINAAAPPPEDLGPEIVPPGKKTKGPTKE